ncbi:MAG: hypothetical protein IPJ74_05050 [Saprospiraceae bacterium]|nr:hypothetical protein [Saprospiraceae bacterium]
MTHLSNPAANLPRGTKAAIQLRGDENRNRRMVVDTRREALFAVPGN